MNCCLFNVEEVLTGGFEMGNIWYNEPKTLGRGLRRDRGYCLKRGQPAVRRVYGAQRGEHFRAPTRKNPMRKRSISISILGWMRKRRRKSPGTTCSGEMEQGFQGWEYKFNSVSSSRGDYPFITVTAGTGRGRFAKMATITMLNVRKKGQGKEGHRKPVLFPKIVFLYDENLHGPGKELEDDL